MHIVLVQIHIKAEYIEVFQNASLDNARNSIQEPGVVRFDVLQQQEDPTRFTLVEVYRKAEDQLKHRETTHYLRWKDAVEPMMAESRVGIKYTNLFPSDTDWS
jgi:(4S)-4-hydroxy-5-phosphonooxypentane-2,3-dione isomerase